MSNNQSSKRTPKFYDYILNERLRDLLENNRTADFADALGITSESVRQWTSGYSRPDMDKLAAIAKYFDCTTDYLLGLSEYKNEKYIKSYNETTAALTGNLQKFHHNGIHMIDPLNRAAFLIQKIGNPKLLLDANLGLLIQMFNYVLENYLSILRNDGTEKNDYIGMSNAAESAIEMISATKKSLTNDLIENLSDDSELKSLLQCDSTLTEGR